MKRSRLLNSGSPSLTPCLARCLHLSILSRAGLSLVAVPALSTVLMASQQTEDAGTAAGSRETRSSALFTWADFDGDSRLDLASVGPDGRLRLLESVDDERFEDVTERVGLAGVSRAALALWGDYDNDGRPDLFVGAREGQSRLFHNDGGAFIDMSAGSGLLSDGPVHSAHWLDHDGDGRLDLHVLTAEKHELFHGLEGGFFERTELPLAGGSPASTNTVDSNGGAAPSAPESRHEKDDARASGNGRLDSLDGIDGSGGRIAVGPSVGGATELLPFPVACASSIRDQANPGSCLEASTTPALGELYPLTANLFVAVGGDVGIGTTSPAAKLDVAGTVRMSDTLTLDPSGDQALDIATGSIYKGGALFMHTRGDDVFKNTALGFQALQNVYPAATGYYGSTVGSYNTAVGHRALYSTTGGIANTATGARALESNLGNSNTATGVGALQFNTAGNDNTAIGAGALQFNTVGNDNTASGTSALLFNTAGYRNTATGADALRANTTGTNNTASGAQALQSNTIGFSNTASGFRALGANSSGADNTATGVFALQANIVGTWNTASGMRALFANTTGYSNTADGRSALESNTTGFNNTAVGVLALRANTTSFNNTAVGLFALQSNTTGSRNIALGAGAGGNLTTGSDNIAIGTGGVAGESTTIRIGDIGVHTRAFIGGVRSVQTGQFNAVSVLIDSNGQLGTFNSSRRFKEDIESMGDSTDRLLELRPVVFRYKTEVEDGEHPLEYGLIAEEVAEIFPELVVHDDEGQPLTVKYHVLSSMLLNELQKLDARLEALSEAHAGELAELRALFEARFAAIEAAR